MTFLLDGCDISFIAEAPEDITLKQLLAQCDRIQEDWCKCGIKSIDKEDIIKEDIDLIITYDDIQKTNEDVHCKIKNK